MMKAIYTSVFLFSLSWACQTLDTSDQLKENCQGLNEDSELMTLSLQSELNELRTAVSSLQTFQDRQEIQEIIAEWRVLLDAAANFRGSNPGYMDSDVALQVKKHYLDHWVDDATLTVTSEDGSPINITGRFTLITLWDDDASFRNFQSNQRIINGLHTVEVSSDRCSAIARGSMNAFYDAYSTTTTVPGAPVVGMMTPFSMVYHFERCNPASGGYAWRVNRVEMIADFFAVLAPNGYDWNNCGRVDIDTQSLCSA